MRLRRRPPTVDLARVVPRLEPSVLHQIVRRWGLEDSSEIVALATSEQLLRVFDVDLWGSDEPGGEEHFDADRFGRWLEVLHEAGPSLAARRIAEMDLDFLTAALAEHLLVLDSTWFLLEAVVEQEAGDDTNAASEGPLDRLYERVLEGEDACEVGGYRVLARRAGPWDALVSLLAELGADHPDVFGRLMERLARASTELLGIENWPRAWLPDGRSEPPADLLVHHDLVDVFRVGWTVLHERVSLHTARTLVEVLPRVSRDDGGVHADLVELRDGLRTQVGAGTPWLERDNLDTLAALDPPTWSVLVGLIDHCPAVPSETGDVEFVAENRQIQWVQGFLGSLPGLWGAG